MKKALSLAFTLYCFYLATRAVEWEQLWTVVSAAQWRYVLVAIPILIASYLLRALRWRYFFPPEVRNQSLHYLFPMLMIAYFANNFFLARAGELARVILMGRHNNIHAQEFSQRLWRNALPTVCS